MTSTIDLEVAPQAAPFRRFTWQEALLDYLPEDRRTALALRWVERVPTAVVLLVTALLALRLRNSAFLDEALYLDAGQDYLNHWFRDAPLPQHGEFFSGAPGVYPVLAAALDAVGGLALVRLFSLLCVLVTVVVVQDTAQRLFDSRRVGLLAGAVFGLTGPVIFIGAFATFDAVCVLLLAVGCWLAVARTGLLSGAGLGLVLLAAVTVKYAGAVFLPVVLALVVVHGGRQGLRRAGLAAVVLAFGVGLVLHRFGEGLRSGIEFTTSDRTALSPTTTGRLLVYLLLNIGLLGVLAVVGTVRAARLRRRLGLTAAVLLAGAALLPVAQLRLGEAVSFDKHTAYSALFLAPLAGLALAGMSRGLLKLAPVLLVLLASLMVGVSRSGTLYQGWPRLDPVLQVIAEDPEPGTYLSSAADSLKYYTRRTAPQIGWETTFGLFSGGEEKIRRAVEDGRYRMIVLRSSQSGSPQQDAGQRLLEEAVRDDPRYRLVRDPIPVQRYSDDVWLIYRLEGAAPPRDAVRGVS